jgi:hypothetical protein
MTPLNRAILKEFINGISIGGEVDIASHHIRFASCLPPFLPREIQPLMCKYYQETLMTWRTSDHLHAGGTNFEAGFRAAFDILDEAESMGLTSNCQVSQQIQSNATIHTQLTH